MVHVSSCTAVEVVLSSFSYILTVTCRDTCTPMPDCAPGAYSHFEPLSVHVAYVGRSVQSFSSRCGFGGKKADLPSIVVKIVEMGCFGVFWPILSKSVKNRSYGSVLMVCGQFWIGMSKLTVGSVLVLGNVKTDRAVNFEN